MKLSPSPPGPFSVTQIEDVRGLRVLAAELETQQPLSGERETTS